jgi:hypothetical protein
MKQCLTSLAIKEMHIKTTLRFPLTQLRLAIIKKTANKHWRGCGGKREPHMPLLGMQTSATTMEISTENPSQNKIDLLYDPIISVWDIYLKVCRSMYKRHISIPMFISALFTIAKCGNS